MARGKPISVAHIQAAFSSKNAFSEDLDTQGFVFTDSMIEVAAKVFEESYNGEETVVGAMRQAISAALASKSPENAWVVCKDSTVGMYGGPVHFSRGQRITDKALAIELRRAGVELKPAA